ncbi:DUF6255 family natural product biosynthesis protein [Streptomyces roseoverticillatus]|uniref:DUF6255 family natural product biosynthesis protein n=1 Tax=Streptomyces roseoverticillatus TaxID=66429 RepID=UPI0035ABFC4B
MTVAVGRLVARCAHAGGWTQEGDAARCDHCGTRRFTGYAALLFAELPQYVAHARATKAPRRDVRRRYGGGRTPYGGHA